MTLDSPSLVRCVMIFSTKSCTKPFVENPRFILEKNSKIKLKDGIIQFNPLIAQNAYIMDANVIKKESVADAVSFLHFWKSNFMVIPSHFNNIVSH